MNRKHLLFHLAEAEEALARTIADLRRDPEYDVGELVVEMQHLYYHLNTAWNGRDATEEQSEEPTEGIFQKWSQYPEDLSTLGS
jgi:hypothetical protein